MPLRDHLSVFKQFPFFDIDRDSEENRQERKALAEFNRVYEQALRQHLRAQAALWRQKYPGVLFTPSTLQSYAKIIRQREAHQDPAYMHIPDSQKAPELELKLPKSVLSLGIYGLIRLAFSQDGENFYHYLNQHLNKAIKLQAAQNCFPDLSSAYFYEHLNRLDTPDFEAQLCHKPLPELYTRIVAFLVTKNFKPLDLACTDGYPLDFIASTFIYRLFDIVYPGKIMAAVTGGKPLNAAGVQTLAYAAHYGCYYAANCVVKHTLGLIQRSKTLQEAEQHYQDYFTTHHPIFVQRYQAAGTLLLLLASRGIAQYLRDFPLKDVASNAARELPWVINNYQILLSAQQQEGHCKNALRLCYNSDSCTARLTELFADHDSPPVTSFEGAKQQLRNFNPDYQMVFDQTEQQFTATTAATARHKQQQRFTM